KKEDGHTKRQRVDLGLQAQPDQEEQQKQQQEQQLATPLLAVSPAGPGDGAADAGRQAAGSTREQAAQEEARGLDLLQSAEEGMRQGNDSKRRRLGLPPRAKPQHAPLQQAEQQQWQQQQQQPAQQQQQQQQQAVQQAEQQASPAARSSPDAPANPAQQPSARDTAGSDAGLPGPGVHVLRQPEQVAALQQQLTGARRLRCLGFALQLSPPSRLGLPPPPREAAKRKRDSSGSRDEAAAAAAGAAAGAATAQQGGGALLGVALSWREGAVAYIPLNSNSSSMDVAAAAGAVVNQARSAASAVAALLQDGLASLDGSGGVPFRATVALQRQATCLQQLLDRPVQLPPHVVDVWLAAWLLHPSSLQEQPQQLDAAAELVLRKAGRHGAYVASCAGLPDAAAGSAASAAAAAAGSPALPPGWLEACRAAASSRAAWLVLQPQLRAVPGLQTVLLRQEVPLAVVLAHMHAVGVGVYVQALRSLDKELERRVEVQREVERAGGRRKHVDLGNCGQVFDLLFKDLRAPVPPSKPSCQTAGPGKKPKRPSTNKDALNKLLRSGNCSPAVCCVVRLVMEFRKIHNTRGFLARLLTSACGGSGGGGGGPDASAAGPPGLAAATTTETGRLAMDKPNLQCVPKPHELRRLLPRGSAEEGEGISSSGNHRLSEANVRAALVAAPGCVLLSADYRQIELHMLAHFSGDEALCAMLQDDGRDPFVALAAQWKNKAEGEVAGADREHTKHMVYALLYGMGDSSLAEDLAPPGQAARPADARRTKEEFLAAFPGVQRWWERARADCRRDGYITMLSGRRRWLPHINSTKWEERSSAERVAVNSIMQGSAADVCKRAMVVLHAELASLGPGAAALVLQIHDEVLLEVDRDQVDQVAALVRQCMENSWHEPLRVPLRVRLAVGPSWGELRALGGQALFQAALGRDPSSVGHELPAELAQWPVTLAAPAAAGATLGGLAQWQEERLRPAAGARRPSPAANLQRLLRVTNSALRRGLALGGLAAAFFGAHVVSYVFRGQRNGVVDSFAGGVAVAAVFGAHAAACPPLWPPSGLPGKMAKIVALGAVQGGVEAWIAQSKRAQAEAALQEEEQRVRTAATASRQRDAASVLLQQLEASLSGSPAAAAAVRQEQRRLLGEGQEAGTCEGTAAEAEAVQGAGGKAGTQRRWW
ncbi:helicase and polymerase-containing TEBICHI, partial [Micractinium conductrix]